MHASFNRIRQLAPACTPSIARGSLSVCCAMLLLLLLVIDMNQLTAVTSRRRRHVTEMYNARNIDIIDGHVSGHRVGPQLV